MHGLRHKLYRYHIFEYIEYLIVSAWDKFATTAQLPRSSFANVSSRTIPRNFLLFTFHSANPVIRSVNGINKLNKTKSPRPTVPPFTLVNFATKIISIYVRTQRLRKYTWRSAR